MDIDFDFRQEIDMDFIILQKFQQHLDFSINFQEISEFRDYFKYLAENFERLFGNKNLLMIEAPKKFKGLEWKESTGFHDLNEKMDVALPVVETSVYKRKAEYFGFPVKFIKL
jgi:hypothetical protein